MRSTAWTTRKTSLGWSDNKGPLFQMFAVEKG